MAGILRFQETSLDLVFNSPSENHAWTLESIKIEKPGVVLRSRTLITAPASYSYFCAQDIVFTGINNGVEYSLTLKGLQVQKTLTRLECPSLNIRALLLAP